MERSHDALRIWTADLQVRRGTTRRTTVAREPAFLARDAARRDAEYWRDFDSLDRWSRSLPHKEWWQKFLSDSGGTGFWHEAYFMRGGMEAVYDDVVQDSASCASRPVTPARGWMFSSRDRANASGAQTIAVPVTEEEFHG